jgi:hypothetical protein
VPWSSSPTPCPTTAFRCCGTPTTRGGPCSRRLGWLRPARGPSPTTGSGGAAPVPRPGPRGHSPAVAGLVYGHRCQLRRLGRSVSSQSITSRSAGGLGRAATPRTQRRRTGHRAARRRVPSTRARGKYEGALLNDPRRGEAFRLSVSTRLHDQRSRHTVWRHTPQWPARLWLESCLRACQVRKRVTLP